VPTSKPRHIVTETDDVRAALDRAGRHFPELDRKRLLLELVRVGDDALRTREEPRTRSREARLAYLEDVSMRRTDAVDWSVLADVDRVAWRGE
jgi:hypothetical protein